MCFSNNTVVESVRIGITDKVCSSSMEDPRWTETTQPRNTPHQCRGRARWEVEGCLSVNKFEKIIDTPHHQDEIM